jgi:Fe-S cluster assembly protein SufB
MSYTEKELKKELDNKSYEFGFVTDIESDKAPVGLNEDVVKLISSKKKEPQWLLNYRLKAFQIWKTMKEPDWAHV